MIASSAILAFMISFASQQQTNEKRLSSQPQSSNPRRRLASSLASRIIFTAVGASSTQSSDLTMHGQQTSGQHTGMQTRLSLPRMQHEKQKVDSICTCSPRPPQQKVMHILQHRVSFRTSSKWMSSKYRTVTLSITASSVQDCPQQEPLAGCILGLFHSMPFSLTMILLIGEK